MEIAEMTISTLTTVWDDGWVHSNSPKMKERGIYFNCIDKSSDTDVPRSDDKI